MRIAGAYLRDFEPFADQPLEFPTKDKSELAEVHFFVGQNGTGKTRLLSLLAAACGNPQELHFRTSKFNSTVVAEKKSELKTNHSFDTNDSNIQAVSLSDIFSKLANYPSLSLGNRTVPMLKKIVSMTYRSVPTLEDQKVIPMGQVNWPEQKYFLTFTHHTNESLQLSQALANLKVRMGIVSSDPKDRTVRMMNAFDEAVKSITNQKLILTVGYVGPDFRLKASWAGKEMQLRQLPDGLRSIIGWLASCVVKLDMLHPDIENPLEQPLILLLDEPDAHLHPAWQRKLIPAVQKLLPNAQIFVATHSPFVISSVNHGWIHVFEADENGIVTIKPAQACSAGDSYIDVVEDILGVREQFDPETEGMLKKFREKREVVKKQQTDSAITEVKELAKEIAVRGETLNFMMGREIAQLETQLNKPAL